MSGNLNRGFYYADLVTAETLCQAIGTAIGIVAAMCRRHWCDPASCVWSVRPGPGPWSTLHVTMAPCELTP